MNNAVAERSIAVISTVHDSYDTRIFYKQIESLRRHYRVHYFSPHRQRPSEEWIVPLYRGVTKLGRLRTHLSLLRRLPRTSADLYLLHDPELLPLGMLLRLFGRRVVWDMHEDTCNDIKTKHYLPRSVRSGIAFVYRAIQAAAFRILNGFILAEDKYAEYFRDSAKFCVVHNYPMLDKLGAHRGAQKEPDTIVYIGNITVNRGVYQLLDVVARLRERIPAIKLLLIGSFADAALEREVRKRVEREGLEKHVDILGQIRNVEAYPLLARCMVGLALLLPEPNFEKSLPTKMFEYMALGLPVVVSAFPMWKEIVERHDAGEAVDPRDVQAICDAIYRLLRDPQHYEHCSAQAVKAASGYSWENESRVLVEFLSKFLQR